MDQHIDLEDKRIYTDVEFEGDPGVLSFLPRAIKLIIDGRPVGHVMSSYYSQESSPILAEYRKLLKRNYITDIAERRVRFKYKPVKMNGGFRDTLIVTAPKKWDFLEPFKAFMSRFVGWKKTQATYDENTTSWTLENPFLPSVFNRLCVGLGFLPKIEGISPSYLERKVKRVLSTYYKEKKV